MLTYIEVKFFFDSACFAASLGEKELLFRKYSPGSCLLAVLAKFLANISSVSFS